VFTLRIGKFDLKNSHQLLELTNSPENDQNSSPKACHQNVSTGVDFAYNEPEKISIFDFKTPFLEK
jgi:hypothetical protein